MTEQDVPLPSQIELNSRLRRGLLFSLLWFCGVGSMYAFVVGVFALRDIRRSSFELEGSGRAWWCVVNGGIGAAFLLWCLLTFVLYQLGIVEV